MTFVVVPLFPFAKDSPPWPEILPEGDRPDGGYGQYLSKGSVGHVILRPEAEESPCAD